MNAQRRHLLWLPLLLTTPAWAQSPPRIVFIWPGSASGELPRSSAFKEGLREIGLVQGRHYQLEELYADGQYDRFPAMAAEVMKQPPALIMVVTIASVQAVQQATKTVPIVFVATNDPLGSGLIASYARPGGNTTGLSSQLEDTLIKNLQLLREVLPRAKRIAALVNPGNPSGPKLFEHLRASALGLGIDAVAFDVASPQGLDAALSAMKQYRPDAFLAMPDSMFFSLRGRIGTFIFENRIPSFATGRESAEAGALISYAFAQSDMFRRSATYVQKILAGAKPADLPVEQPTKFELIINLKTARALGLTIPQSLLLRADEVIE